MVPSVFLLAITLPVVKDTKNNGPTSPINASFPRSLHHPTTPLRRDLTWVCMRVVKNLRAFRIRASNKAPVKGQPAQGSNEQPPRAPPAKLKCGQQGAATERPPGMHHKTVSKVAAKRSRKGAASGCERAAQRGQPDGTAEREN